MKKFMCVKIGLMISFLILVFICLYENYHVREFKKITNELTHSSSFKNIIEKAESQYNNKTIKITLTLDSKYNGYKTIEKFEFLEAFQRQFRYFIRNSKYLSQKQKESITLLVNANTSTYTFTNIYLNKNRLYHSESTLYKDKKKIYSNIYLSGTGNGYLFSSSTSEFEKEVLQYASYLFRSLTKHGSDYYDDDTKMIADIVTKKFNISFNEYDAIYRKNYLGMQ